MRKGQVETGDHKSCEIGRGLSVETIVTFELFPGGLLQTGVLWHRSRPSEIRKSNMIIVGVLTLMNIIIITPSERASDRARNQNSRRAGCYRAIIHSACSGGRATHRKKRGDRTVRRSGLRERRNAIIVLNRVVMGHATCDGCNAELG